MTTPRGRFEVVRGEGGEWFARFRAPNGKTVWVTETYKRRAGALNAIDSIAAVFHGNLTDDNTGVSGGGWGAATGDRTDIDYIDETTPKEEEPDSDQPPLL